MENGSPAGSSSGVDFEEVLFQRQEEEQQQQEQQEALLIKALAALKVQNNIGDDQNDDDDQPYSEEETAFLLSLQDLEPEPFHPLDALYSSSDFDFLDDDGVDDDDTIKSDSGDLAEVSRDFDFTATAVAVLGDNDEENEKEDKNIPALNNTVTTTTTTATTTSEEDELEHSFLPAIDYFGSSGAGEAGDEIDSFFVDSDELFHVFDHEHVLGQEFQNEPRYHKSGIVTDDEGDSDNIDEDAEYMDNLEEDSCGSDKIDEEKGITNINHNDEDKDDDINNQGPIDLEHLYEVLAAGGPLELDTEELYQELTAMAFFENNNMDDDTNENTTDMTTKKERERAELLIWPGMEVGNGNGALSSQYEQGLFACQPCAPLPSSLLPPPPPPSSLSQLQEELAVAHRDENKNKNKNNTTTPTTANTSYDDDDDDDAMTKKKKLKTGADEGEADVFACLPCAAPSSPPATTNDKNTTTTTHATAMSKLLTWTGSDGLPASYSCQPCHLEDFPEEELPPPMLGTVPSRAWGSDLAPISEDEHYGAVREHYKDELRELYAASARQPHSTPHQQQQNRPQQLQQYQENEEDDANVEDREQQYPEIEETTRNTAAQWMTGFGISPEYRKPIPGACLMGTSAKTCYGHKETIFGVAYHPDTGKYLATASQDATVKIWDTTTQKLVTTLTGHDKLHECLRVDWAATHWAEDILDRAPSSPFSQLLASSGADGTVKLWSSAGGTNIRRWKCEYTLDHGAILASSGPQQSQQGCDGVSNSNNNTKPEEKEDEDDSTKPQVYALQFIDHWKVFDQDPQQHSFLMTSSDEYIHLWEIPRHPFDQQLQFPGNHGTDGQNSNGDSHKIRILQDEIKQLNEVMSLHFGPLDQFTFGVTVCSVTGTVPQLPGPPHQQCHQSRSNSTTNFGGPRNPKNTIFVFDASYCPANGLLGVALSDGTLRLVNGRGLCISVIDIPGSNSHLTSFCWNNDGTRLATCVATGHLLAWYLDPASHDGGKRHTVATCTAIFEGGHEQGRPLFGSKYCGGDGPDDDDLLISWGIDGKICMWYSKSHGNIHEPVAVLKDDKEYPIYAVGATASKSKKTAERPQQQRTVAVCGGSAESGFIGTPFHLYKIPSPPVESSSEYRDNGGDT